VGENRSDVELICPANQTGIDLLKHSEKNMEKKTNRVKIVIIRIQIGKYEFKLSTQLS